MASSNRTAILTKTIKVLKKHYKPSDSKEERSLLEQLLFACCLENSPPDAAETVYKALREQFFDWNEVRVSSIRELAEGMHGLADPEDAARRVKSVLQHVFEGLYSFDLEGLKRQNIGQAVKKLEKYQGATPFGIAYVVQHALGGHAIPVNRGAIQAFCVLGAISDVEA